MTEDASYALDLCDRIAALTDVPGTVTRLFLSPAARHVHTLLTAEMQQLGMSTRVDNCGNLRGTYAAQQPNAPTLLLGSHVDTVPNAGRYDGILGVTMALALVRALNGRKLPYALEVIAFSEEEGIRFRLPFIGSRALAGTLGAAELARADGAGTTVAEAITAWGLDPHALDDATPTPGTFAFFELHIEQGPVLESLGLPLGIVSAIAGQTRLQLTFTGEANHAGTTPMALRKDALAGTARFIVAVQTYAQRRAGLVATVGIIEAQPGAANIVPGRATISLDVRHAEDAQRLNAIEALLAQAQSIASRRGLTLASVVTSEQAAVPMSPAFQQQLSAAIAASGLPVHTMVSGAGHDAMIVASRVPAAMLFLRTPRGLSHHPDEAVAGEDVQAALDACLHLLDHLDPSSIPERTP